MKKSTKIIALIITVALCVFSLIGCTESSPMKTARTYISSISGEIKISAMKTIKTESQEAMEVIIDKQLSDFKGGKLELVTISEKDITETTATIIADIKVTIPGVVDETTKEVGEETIIEVTWTISIEKIGKIWLISNITSVANPASPA